MMRGGNAISRAPRVATRPALRLTMTLVAVLMLAGLAVGAIVVDLPLPAGIQTPAYSPGQVAFHPGQQVSYTVSWEGLPVARARISLRTDPKHAKAWVGEALVSTNRLVDVFYRMRAYLRDEFAERSLASDEVFISQDENGRLAEYQVTFHRAQGMVETIRRKHDHTEEKRFLASHPLGPIGGTMLALSQPLKVGDTITLDVFAATERYVVSFRVARHEQIHIGADDIDALRVIPSILYVSNPQKHYKVRQAIIWLSAADHLPLRIIADTFVGRIYIDLAKPRAVIGPSRSAG
jgi:Protein of unknown function (DUF3108)